MEGRKCLLLHAGSSQRLGYTAREVLAHSLITENSSSSAAKFIHVQSPNMRQHAGRVQGKSGHNWVSYKARNKWRMESISVSLASCNYDFVVTNN